MPPTSGITLVFLFICLNALTPEQVEQQRANKIPNPLNPRASLNKNRVLKSFAHAVLAIRFISYPRIRQLRPAIRPYCGLNIEFNVPYNVLMIPVKAVPTAASLALYPVVAVLYRVRVAAIRVWTGP